MKAALQVLFATIAFALAAPMATAQTASISGRIIANGKALEFASEGIPGTPHGTYTDAADNYRIENVPAGTFKLQASSVGFTKIEKTVTLKEGQKVILNFDF